jgi:hypothetical protein
MSSTSLATSTASGALQVSGGVGVGGNLFVGGNSATSGNVVMSSTTLAISTASGALQVAGGVGVGGNLFVGGNSATSGNVVMSSTTLATSTASGALQVSGGVGVGGNLFVGGNSATSGNVVMSSTTLATSTASGALKVAGGVGVGGKLYVGSTLNVKTVDFDSSSNDISLYATTTVGNVNIATASSKIGSQAIVIGDSTTGNIFVGGSLFNASTGNIAVVNASTSVNTPTVNTATVNASTAVIVSSTTVAANTASGALQVSGGVGIGGKLYVGSDLSVTGAASFTTIPTAPTSVDVSSNQLATTAYVRGAIYDLVNGAGTALDTLYEIANAINNDPSYNANILIAIGERSLDSTVVHRTGDLAESINGRKTFTTDVSMNTALSVGGILNVKTIDSDSASNAISLYAATTSGNVNIATAATKVGAQAIVIGDSTSGNIFIGGSRFNASTGNIAVVNASTSVNTPTVNAATVNASTAVIITSTSVASDTATGALRVSGGVGVGGSLFVGGNSATSGNVVMSSTTLATSTASGALQVSGGVGVGGNLFVGGNSITSGNVVMSSTTLATSTASGALQVSGGVGVGGNLFVGGNSATSGNVVMSSTTLATSTTTGALRVSGGVGVGGNLFVGGNSATSGRSTFGAPPTSTTYEIDVSGQIRIYETTGTTLSATAGSLVFEHGDASGQSSILFRSKNDPTSDYAYIQYQENVGGPAQKGLLTIGIENESGSGTTADRISLFSAGGSGFVGVNTKDPSAHLDVSGNVTISNTITTTNYSSNNFIGGNVNLTSPITVMNRIFANLTSIASSSVTISGITPSFYNGVYDFSASSFVATTGDPYKAFNNTSNTTWTCDTSGGARGYNQPPYLTVAPFSYRGGTIGDTATNYFTTVVDGQTISGEWLQIKTPTAYGIMSYSINRAADPANGHKHMPSEFYLAGSNDGSTWSLIDYRNENQNIIKANAPIYSYDFNFTLNTKSSNYTYFRLIPTKLKTGTSGFLSIGDFYLYGEPAGYSMGKTTVSTDLQLFGKVFANDTEVSGNMLFRSRVKQDFKDNSFVSMNGFYALDHMKAPVTSIENVKDAVSTWTPRYNPSAAINSICWSSTLRIFCAVGTNKAHTSPDGINWTTTDISSNVALTYRDVVWVPELNTFCAVASGPTTANSLVALSSNGTTWNTNTTHTATNSSGFYAIDWSPELKMFNAVGNRNISPVNGFMYSYDGITWTSIDIGSLHNSVVWANSLKKFVISNGSVALGTLDGKSLVSTFINFQNAAYNSVSSLKLVWSPQLNMLVAYGATNIFTSYDGLSWKMVQDIVLTGTTNCTWSAELGVFCLIDSASKCYISNDGITWSSISISATITNLTSSKQLCWSPDLGIFCFAPGVSGDSFLTSSFTERIPTAYNMFNSNNGIQSVDENGNWSFVKNTSVGGNLVVSSTTLATSTASGALVVSGGVGVGGNLFVGGNSVTSGNVVMSSTTLATSTASGALQVSGGVGVGGNLFVGGNGIVNSTTNTSDISSGAFIVKGGVGIVQDLRVGGTIYGNIQGVINSVISSESSILANATVNATSTTSGALIVKGGVGIGGDLFVGGNSATYGNVVISSTTLATSTASGALQVSGGVGIGGNLFVGGNSATSGNVVMSSTTLATSTASGALQVSGGVGVGGNLFVGGNSATSGRSTFGAPPTSTTYEVDVSGQIRIFETTGTTLSATTGSLVFEHGDASGQSSILFRSKNDPTADYAYIQYQENVGGPAQKGLLTIGIENESGSGTTADRISLFSAGGSGFVGVNTKDPSAHLDVSGNVTISNTITTTNYSSNNFIGGNVNLTLPIPVMNGIFANSISINSSSVTISGITPSFYNGVYDFSASTFDIHNSILGNPFKAFDNNYGNYWACDTSGGSRGYNQTPYLTVAPFSYRGGTIGDTATNYFTTMVDGQTISGEWLQIKTPTAYGIMSYSINKGGFDINNAYKGAPSEFYLAGSNDGSTWSLIDYRNENQNLIVSGGNAYHFNFTLNTKSSNYTFFRLIFTKLKTNTFGRLVISDFSLLGEPVGYSMGKTTVSNDLQLFGKVFANDTEVSGNMLFRSRVKQDFKDASYSSMNGFYALDHMKAPVTSIENVKDAVSTWTPRYNPSAVINGICWSSTLRIFCAVGTNKAHTSPDGINWTTTDISSNVALIYRDVVWVPELNTFCAVASGSTTANSLVALSSNGTTWNTNTTHTATHINGFYSISWSPELKMFNVIGNNNNTPANGFMYSYDGITWTTVQSGGNFYSGVWANSLKKFTFISTSGGLSNGTSNGQSFFGLWLTLQNSTYNNNPTKLVWSPQLNMLVAYGATNIFTSYDGVSWTMVQNLVLTGSTNCTWSAELGVFCLFDSSKCYISNDGVTWSSISISAAITNWNDKKQLCWSPDLGIFCFAPGASGQSFLTSSFKERIPTAYNLFNSSNGIQSVDESGNWTFVKNTNVGGNLVVSSTTLATSTASGALVVSGGVGVGGNLFVGGNSITIGNSVTSGNVVMSSTTLATSTASGALQVSGGVGVGGNLFVGGNSATSGNVVMSSTTLATSTASGALQVSGGVGVGGNLFVGGNSATSGNVVMSSTTLATSTASGALQVSGGVGVGGNLFVGGNSATSGNVVMSSTTLATSTASGALQVSGGVGVGGSLFVGGDLSVTGAASFSTIPTAPTSVDLSSNQLATTAYVRGAINNLVNGAGAALDTLYEIADALGNDASFSANVFIAINDRALDSSVVHRTGDLAESINGLKTFTTDVSMNAGLSVGGTLKVKTIDSDSGSNAISLYAATTSGNVNIATAASKLGAQAIVIGDSTSGNIFIGGSRFNASTGNIAVVNASTSVNTPTVNAATVNASTAVIITSTSVASDTATGALRVSGGVGVGGNLFVGGNSATSGNVVMSSTTLATSTASGALQVSGGVGVGGNLFVGGNSVTSGNLSVSNGTIKTTGFGLTQPPSPMTSNVTNIPGHGAYYAYHSSQAATDGLNYPYYLYDRTTTSVTSPSLYTTIDGSFNIWGGSDTISDVGGTAYPGYRFHIDLPYQINLSQFLIEHQISSRIAVRGTMLASNNGTSWNNIYSFDLSGTINGNTISTNPTGNFTFDNSNNTSFYSKYALVVNRICVTATNITRFGIRNLYLTGNNNILSTQGIGTTSIGVSDNLTVGSVANIYGNLTVGITGDTLYNNSSAKLLIAEPTGTIASATSGSLVLQHGDVSGASSIVFRSKNSANDYAYIQYQENVGGPLEKGLLTIGIENESGSGTTADRISLFSAGGSGFVGVNTKNPSTHLDVSGSSTISGTFSVSSTTLATSTSSGALVVSGGVGVGGNLFVGGNSATSGNVVMSSTTLSTSTSTGALLVSGGVGIGGNLFVGGNLSVSGKVGFGTAPSTTYEVDVSGQMRIYETTGTTLSATTGSLVFEHGDASGQSSILFRSKNDPTADYAYIQYQENVGGPAQKGLLTIGIENESGSGTTADRISLFSANGSGFVGVNTKNPSAHLDVSGNVTISNTITTTNYSGNNFIGGNVNLTLPIPVMNTIFANSTSINASSVTISGITPSFYNGVYDFSASTFVVTGEPYKAFDENAANSWTCDTSGGSRGYNQTPYLLTSPYSYRGGTIGSTTTNYFTTVVDGQTISGEWLQIKTPTAFNVTSYSLSRGPSSSIVHRVLPSEFYLLGSNNGTTWTQLDFRNEVQNFNQNVFGVTEMNFTINKTSAYTYFRIINTKVRVSTLGYISISDFRLFGEPTGYSMGKTTVTNDLQLFGKVFANNTEVSGNMLFRNRVKQDYKDASYSSMNGFYGLDHQKAPVTNIENAKKAVSTWSAVYSPGVIVNTVCWSSTLRTFCAVGTNKAYTSPNGMTWTASDISSNTLMDYRDVVWAPELGIFCAVGAGTGASLIDASRNCIATSTNGISWNTNITHGGVGGNPGLTTIAWSPELRIFNIIGTNGVNGFLYSSDGINWTSAGVGGNYFGSTWAPDLKCFLFLSSTSGGGGIDLGISSGTSHYSGASVILANALYDSFPSRLVWSPQLKMAVAYGSKQIFTSYDGLNWRTVPNITLSATGPSFCTWSAELGIFCLIDPITKNVYVSNNGIDWSSFNVPTLPTSTVRFVGRRMCWSPELGIFCFTPAATNESFCISSLSERVPTAYNMFDSNNGIQSVDQSGNLSFVKNTSVGGNLVVSSTTLATSTSSGALVVSGGVGVGGNLFVGGNSATSGNVVMSSTTLSTSTSTGALLVSGGVGVGGNLFVGGSLFNASTGNIAIVNASTSVNTATVNASTSIVITSTTLSTSTSTGALLVSGGVGVGGNLFVGGNLSVTGTASFSTIPTAPTSVDLSSNQLATTAYVRGAIYDLVNGAGAALDTLYEIATALGNDASFSANVFIAINDRALDSSVVHRTGDLAESISGAKTFIADVSMNNALRVGTSVNTNTLVVSSANASTSTASGALQVSGGVGVGGSLYVGSDMSVSGKVGFGIAPSTTYEVDVSGQMRIYETTGSTASATTGSLVLEHGNASGTSSLVFKAANSSTTSDYAYIQYEDNTGYTPSVLEYDLSASYTNANLFAGIPSTGTSTVTLKKITSDMSINSVLVSNVGAVPSQFPTGVFCLSFNQYNLTNSSTVRVSYLTVNNLGAINTFGTGFTFSVWIRPTVVAATSGTGACNFFIVNSSTSPGSNTAVPLSIYIDGNSLSPDFQKIVTLIDNDSVNRKSTSTTLTPNTWVHYVFTFNNATSTGNHYLNGVLNETTISNGYAGKQLTSVAELFQIGTRYGGDTGLTGWKGFHGYMNYINMFDRALSATDIAVLYNTPGHTQTSVERGLMTLGIENEPGTVFNDRIALWPANGSGFVGINNKSPTCALDVSGSINSTGALSVTGSTTIFDLSFATTLAGGIIVNNTNSNAKLILGSYFTAGDRAACAIQSTDRYNNRDNGMELLLNPLGGVVGINTKKANTSYSLDVSGTVNARTYLGTTGNIATVNSTTTNANTISATAAGTTVNLFNTQSTGSINFGGGLTTGSLNIGTGTAWTTGNINIGTASSRPADSLTNIGGTVNLGSAAFVVTVAGTTLSTSTSTGALRVSGGVGVGGNLFVGGNLVSTGTAYATTATAGTDTTQVATTAFVQTGLLSKANTTDVVTLTGAQNVGGSKTFTSDAIVSSTSVSTTTASGALQVSGGVGVGGNLFVGGNLVSTGTAYATTATSGTDTTQVATTAFVQAGLLSKANTTDVVTLTGAQNVGGSKTFTSDAIVSSTSVSTTTASGALQVSGGVGVGGNLFVGSGLSVTGAASFSTIPTAPTSVDISSNQLATTAYVRGAIYNLVNGADAALDTLYEIATALGNDASFSANVFIAINDRALDSSVVHRTGDLAESINGRKTFTTDVSMNTGLSVGGTLNVKTIDSDSASNPISLYATTTSGNVSIATAANKVGAQAINIGNATTGNIFIGSSRFNNTTAFITTGNIGTVNSTTVVATTGNIATVNANTISATAAGTTVNLFNTQNTGSINFGGGLTTGSLNIGTGTAWTTGNINIGTASSRPAASLTNIGGTVNLGSAAFVVTVAGTTVSTSTSTGALLVSGGVGVGGNLFVGGNLVSTGTAYATTATAGTDTTQVATTAFVQAGLLSKANTTDVVTVTGAQNVGGSKTFTSDAIVSSTTLSTSTSTGALRVSGGVGVGGNLFVGGNLVSTGTAYATTATTGTNTTQIATTAFVKNSIDTLNAGLVHNSGDEPIGGDKTFTSTTVSTSTASGALLVSGGVGVGGNLFVGGDLSVTGKIGLGIAPSTTYELDVGGQTRIFETTGSTAGTSTGTLVLEHGNASGASSLVFKAPSQSTNDYAYIQYEDNTGYTPPVIDFDLSSSYTTTDLCFNGISSTGSNTLSKFRRGIVDASINSANVYVVGGTIPTQFPPNSLFCLSFNQTNRVDAGATRVSYMQANSIAYSPDVTFSAWIRPTTVSSTNCRFNIVDASGSYNFLIGGGNISLYTGSDLTNGIRTTITNGITVNTWNHVAFTTNGISGNIYVNGNEPSREILGIGLTNSLTVQNTVLFGAKSGVPLGNSIGVRQKGFHGYMNYVSIFDRTLNLNDISGIYNNPAYQPEIVTERGLMTIGIENDSGSLFNDRITLWPAGGTGFVGINTKTPGFTLDVSGNVNATSYNATSDYRIKENVVPLDLTFNVDVLKPVSYNLKGNDSHLHVGFIAHEVQEVYPFLVNGVKDGAAIQSINYNGFIGILTKEIQVLKKKDEENQAKMVAQESRLVAQESRLVAQESRIKSLEDDVAELKLLVKQ